MVEIDAAWIRAVPALGVYTASDSESPGAEDREIGQELSSIHAAEFSRAQHAEQ